jgi:excisionase family DNA binding protein
MESSSDTPDSAPPHRTVGERRILRRRADERLVYTVAEAARLLAISRAHAYDLVASGELSHLRLGRRVVIPKRVIEGLLDVGMNDVAASRRDAEQSDLPRLGR